MAVDSPQERRAIAPEPRRDNQATPAASASAESTPSLQAHGLTEHEIDTLTPVQTTIDAASTAQSDDESGYSRVTADKALAIKQLRKLGKNGQEIAAAIGVHPSTVSRWLKLLETDTVPESRQLAKSQALRATMKLMDQVDHSDPRVSQGAAKAITALAGVQEGSAPVQVGVQVVVGSASQPAGPDPFAQPIVDASAQVVDS